MVRKLNKETGELEEMETPPKLFWKTPFNHDTNAESDRVALTCHDESLARQEFVEESDINVMLERFQRTGQLPPMALPEHFIDISDKLTYKEIEERLAEANAVFYNLPPDIRYASSNSPALWSDQVMKALAKGDGDRLVELGLARDEKLAAKAPPRPEPANPPGGATPAPPDPKGAASGS